MECYGPTKSLTLRESWAGSFTLNNSLPSTNQKARPLPTRTYSHILSLAPTTQITEPVKPFRSDSTTFYGSGTGNTSFRCSTTWQRPVLELGNKSELSRALYVPGQMRQTLNQITTIIVITPQAHHR